MGRLQISSELGKDGQAQSFPVHYIRRCYAGRPSVMERMKGNLVLRQAGETVTLEDYTEFDKPQVVFRWSNRDAVLYLGGVLTLPILFGLVGMMALEFG